MLLSSSVTVLHLVGSIVDGVGFLSNGLMGFVHPLELPHSQDVAQKLQQS